MDAAKISHMPALRITIQLVDDGMVAFARRGTKLVGVGTTTIQSHPVGERAVLRSLVEDMRLGRRARRLTFAQAVAS